MNWVTIRNKLINLDNIVSIEKVQVPGKEAPEYWFKPVHGPSITVSLNESEFNHLNAVIWNNNRFSIT